MRPLPSSMIACPASSRPTVNVLLNFTMPPLPNWLSRLPDGGGPDGVSLPPPPPPQAESSNTTTKCQCAKRHGVKVFIIAYSLPFLLYCGSHALSRVVILVA